MSPLNETPDDEMVCPRCATSYHPPFWTSSPRCTYDDALLVPLDAWLSRDPAATQRSPAGPPDVSRCDVRGCAGVGGYRYASMIHDRPAVVLVCSLHRLAQWTFVDQTPIVDSGATDDPPEDDNIGSATSRPADTISRVEWLRLEIEAADQYVARHRESTDPIEQSQVQRRQCEAADLRVQLAVLERWPTR